MSWFKEIEIDAAKGDEKGERYTIHLWGYEGKGKKKGQCIGSITLRTCPYDSVDKAKKDAQELWKHWVSKFELTQIEIWIHNDHTSGLGKKGALFAADNFAGFKEKDPF